MTRQFAFSILLLLTTAILVALVSRCDPIDGAPQAGFGGNAVINGRVMIDDTLSGQKIPLAGAVVRIGFNNPDTTTLQSSATTNAGGYYEFNYLQGGLKDKAKYYLACLYTRKNSFASVQYVKQDVVTFTDQNQTVTKDLLLEPKGGVFSLVGSAQVMDVLTGQTRKKPGIRVTLSRQTVPADPYGYSVLTDSDGNFHFYNLNPEKYKLNYQLVANNGNDVLSYTATNSFTATSSSTAGSNTISAEPASITSATTVAGKQFNIGNSTLMLESAGDLILLVQDDQNVAQPNLTYCLYANETLFNTYTKCEHNIAYGTTNSSGRALIRNLPNNTTLYVRVYDDKDNPRLSGTMSITTMTGSTSRTIPVH